MNTMNRTLQPPHLVSDLQPMIEDQLAIMRAMILPNGAVLASPNGHYKAHWVRDGLYVLIAAVYQGQSDLSHQLIRAPFSIFHKHRGRILDGIRRKPDKNSKYVNARYHPAHFDEFADEWGHNQLDMIGLFLYLAAKLPEKGIAALLYNRQYEDKILLNHITHYLETLEWWHCEDHGVWEESRKRNSSSIGAVLAGLRALSNLEDHDLFFNEAQLEKGQKALDELLPKESEDRDCDLAQLSLIWPLGILQEEQTHTVLQNVEEKLAGERGVIRYRGDAYFNSADDRLITFRDPRIDREVFDYRKEDSNRFPFSREGSEAQWPMGFAWLAIVYYKLAKQRFMRGEEHGELKEKARVFLDKLKASVVPVSGRAVGFIPELYVGDKPNANTPLTWATALAIVAAVAYSEIEDRDVPFSAL
jgi:phosphorylase kinase alpha/beta subunit